MRSVIIKRLFLLSVLLFPFGLEAATLSLSPTTQSVVVGDTFSVNIILDTTGASIDGVDVTYLNYNPALLQVQDANPSTAGIQITPGSLMPSTPSNGVDASLGRITFSQIISGGGSKYQGTGILATVTFKALAAGTANVTLNHTPSNTTDSNVASAGTDLLTAVTNGTYTVRTNIVPDTTTPTISITSPANNASISGEVNLSAQAFDNIGVVGVQFKLDGANLGSELIVAPYSGKWNTIGVSAGSHVITAVARDAAGNTKTSNPITVTVSNATPNIAPTVNAGNDQTVTLPNTALLEGVAIDPDSTNLTYTWSKVSGPQLAANAFVVSSSKTTVTFSTAGIYVFKLTVSDGTNSVSDEVTVIVQSAPVVTTDTDGDGIPDTIDKCPRTPVLLTSKVNGLGCPLPKMTRFSHKTNLANADLSAINSFELGNIYGKVSYSTNLNLLRNGGDNELDVDANLYIQNASVNLEASNLPELNKSATVTFYNVTFSNPRILKNGAVCSNCTIISYNNKNLVFTVSGFSTYTVEEIPASQLQNPPQTPAQTIPTPLGVFTPTVSQVPVIIPVAPINYVPQNRPSTYTPKKSTTPTNVITKKSKSDPTTFVPLPEVEEEVIDSIKDETLTAQFKRIVTYIVKRIKKGFLRVIGK